MRGLRRKKKREGGGEGKGGREGSLFSRCYESIKVEVQKASQTLIYTLHLRRLCRSSTLNLNQRTAGHYKSLNQKPLQDHYKQANGHICMPPDPALVPPHSWKPWSVHRAQRSKEAWLTISQGQPASRARRSVALILVSGLTVL